METGEVSRQARPQGFGEAAPITADQLASAIASAQTALGRPTPPSPGKIKVPMLTLIGMREGTFHPLVKYFVRFGQWSDTVCNATSYKL